jgi:RHS repeat-associated protein
MSTLLRTIILFPVAALFCFGQGYLDSVSCTTVAGWAYKTGGNPSTVLLYRDGTQFASLIANLYRSDVQTAIGGDGLNGFDIAVPATLLDNTTHTITAVVSGGSSLNNPTSNTIHCSPAAPYYAYSEIASTTPSPSDPGNWTGNGAMGSGYPGGSYMWKNAPAAWNSEYEVRTTLNLTAQPSGAFGGVFQHYLRGQQNAVSGAGGDTILVELQNPTFSGGGCTANLAVYQISGGYAYQALSAPVACTATTVMRSVVYQNIVLILVGNQFFSVPTSGISGAPGYGSWGIPSGNSVSQVEIGPRNTAAPNPINTQSIAASPFPNFVDLRWQEPVDTTGVGIAYYWVLRSLHGVGDFSYNFDTPTGTATDPNAVPNTAYDYIICQISFHGVLGGCPLINVTTPDASNVDPRRVGVRPTGNYWGDKGEQIDVLSGNLNYTLPLVTAKSRGGHAFTFNLNYNSQIWRQDVAGTWLLGEDLGYGMGWRLQAGSLTPYASSWGITDHYLFVDSTGAEYRLYASAISGQWISKESIRVTYDSNANRLYFNDGSFWMMGCTSSGTEADLGTMYPTQMQDANGNYITITYKQGGGTTWPNSSARIDQIYDVRANSTYPPPTYTFNYDPNSNTLASISPGIGIAMIGFNPHILTFTTSIQNLNSPTASGISFGNANVLNNVMAAPGYTTSFTYDAGAELSRVTFPTGGHLRYSYRTWDYKGASSGQVRSIREVSNRYLSMKSDGSGEYTYPIGRSGDPNDGSLGVHYWCTIGDPLDNGFKVWFFAASSSIPAWQLGLAGNFNDRVSSSNSFSPRQYYYTWSQDPGGNPFISTRQTLWDGGMSYQQNSYETQTLDTNGNLLTRNMYDYTNSATPIRKYTYTYLTDTNYTSRFIRNKMLTATVTDGSGANSVTLASNQYDSPNNLLGQCGWGGNVPTYTPGQVWHDSAYDNNFIFRGNLTQQLTPSGKTCSAYDQFGNPYFTKSPHTAGASVGNITSNYSQPSGITANSDSNSSVGIAYDALFLPVSFSAPNGLNANAMHDAFGRLTTSTSTDGARTDYTYSTGAPPMTQTVTIGIPDSQTGLLLSATWTQTTLDGVGRVIKVQSGPGTTPGNAVTETDTAYGPCACSPLGKMWSTSQPFVPGAQVYWTNYTYDAIGRTVSVQSPDGASTTTYSYQGNSAKVTDPAGKWKTTVSDIQGNTVQVTEPDPVSTSGGSLLTYYSFDTMEHLKQVTMPRSNGTQTRNFNYDATTHLLTSETHPETGTTSYMYTADATTNDMLTLKTDANGQVTKYTYDSYYRITAINRYHNTSNLNINLDDPCQRVNYVYDAYSSSAFTSQNAWGRAAAVSTGDPSCTIVPDNIGAGGLIQQQFTELYSYSISGHVTQKRLQLYQQNGGDPNQQYVSWWDIGYTYNKFGQVASMTYPSGYLTPVPQLHMGFDNMQRPANLSLLAPNTSVQSIVVGVSYNTANQPIQTQFYSGNYGNFWENRNYNSQNQLVGVNNFNTGPTQVNGANLNINYNYPAGQNNGQISTMVDNALGQTVNYSYDALKRLTGATGTGQNAWSQTYMYDSFGNMTQKSGSGMVFTNNVDPTTNRLSYGTFCYDPNGNMVSDQNGGGCGNPTYVYDIANRMVAANLPNRGKETYQYDADNKRLSKITMTPLNDGSGNQTYSQTVYIYGVMGEKLTVAVSPYGPAGVGNGAAALYAVHNVYWSGRLIVQNSTLLPGTGHYMDFTGTDRLGSVINDGTPGRTFYLPYGEETTTQTANERIKFATYTRDDSTKLDYADQRYYTSQFGRFLSADRSHLNIGLTVSGSWNKYSYVNGDPVNAYDPTGRDCTLVDNGTGVLVLFCTDTGGGGGGRGGGGGGGTPSLEAPPDEPSNTSGYTPQNADLLPSALARAIDGLKSYKDCLDLFGTADSRSHGFNPIDVLQQISKQIKFVPLPYAALTIPVPVTTGPGLPIFVGQILINSLAFQGTNSWNNGDTFNNTLTLLHELGHWYDYTTFSGGSQLHTPDGLFMNEANDSLVTTKCLTVH